MIIEMHLNLTKEKTLLATWEVPKPIWEQKSILLLGFIKEIFTLQKVEYQKKDLNGILIYKINTPPYKFYELQNYFNDLFKSIGAFVSVE